MEAANVDNHAEDGSDLDRQIRVLRAEIQAAEARATEAYRRVRSTDWSVDEVGGHPRPAGMSRSEARRLRLVSIAEESVAREEVKRLRGELQPLQRQRDDLAAALERANAPTMSELKQQAVQLTRQRRKLEEARAAHWADLERIHETVAGLSEAADRLAEARAIVFLKPTAEAEQRVADAELSHDVAASAASNGAAARGFVEAEIARLDGELEAIDVPLEKVRAAIAQLEHEAATEAAKQRYARLLEEARLTLEQLLAADADLAYKVWKSWRSDGLRSLDDRGWIGDAPVWLRSFRTAAQSRTQGGL